MATIAIKSEKHNSLIIPSKTDAAKGVIMVKSTEILLNSNGFLNSTTRVGLIKGSIKDLESLNLKEGQEVPFKIVYQEATEPFYIGQEPKIYPENSEKAGQQCTHMGAPIYLNKVVVPVNSDLQDQLLIIDKEPVSIKSTSKISDVVNSIKIN